MKNNGIEYYSQRAVENNKQKKHAQEAESQSNQGKFPHPGVWRSGNIGLARLQSLCTAMFSDLSLSKVLYCTCSYHVHVLITVLQLFFLVQLDQEEPHPKSHFQT